jgi:hypothetical protein
MIPATRGCNTSITLRLIAIRHPGVNVIEDSGWQRAFGGKDEKAEIGDGCADMSDK